MTDVATGFTRLSPTCAYSWAVRVQVIGVVCRGQGVGNDYLQWYCVADLQSLDLLQSPNLETSLPISNVNVPVIQPFRPKPSPVDQGANPTYQNNQA